MDCGVEGSLSRGKRTWKEGVVYYGDVGISEFQTIPTKFCLMVALILISAYCYSFEMSGEEKKGTVVG